MEGGRGDAGGPVSWHFRFLRFRLYSRGFLASFATNEEKARGEERREGGGGGNVNGELRLDNRDTDVGGCEEVEGEGGNLRAHGKQSLCFGEDSTAGILPQNINQAASITENVVMFRSVPARCIM